MNWQENWILHSASAEFLGEELHVHIHTGLINLTSGICRPFQKQHKVPVKCRYGKRACKRDQRNSFFFLEELFSQREWGHSIARCHYVRRGPRAEGEGVSQRERQMESGTAQHCFLETSVFMRHWIGSGDLNGGDQDRKCAQTLTDILH